MEVVFSSSSLRADLEFFTGRLGFVLDTIFPADDPRVATLSGHGFRLRLDRNAETTGGALRLAVPDPDKIAGGSRKLVSPSGVRVRIVETAAPVEVPTPRHELVIQRLERADAWVTGRAGMLYRDLIPGRLGGAVIASHIRIPDAGPVDDLVHFHDVRFQLIFCLEGWVRVVYEDQGDPFVLEAGDCLLQPPRIRHRVLEASAGLEVLELTTPAEHLTTMDHSLALPHPRVEPERVFEGQRFIRSRAAEGAWLSAPWAGFEARDTGIGEASGGVGSVHVLRPSGEEETRRTRHTADLLFGFVWKGRVTLSAGEEPAQALSAGDAFVLPPGLATAFTGASRDLQFVEVALPAGFQTVETNPQES